MNKDFAKQVARDNWYLLVLMAAIIAVAVFKLMSSPEEPIQSASAIAMQPARAERSTSAPPRDIVAVERESARAEIISKIKENEAALAANNEPEKASAYINGIGNMYFQRLQDYSAAASYYERVISDYPDTPAIYQTYVQLVTCYERLNDQEKRKSILRKMLTAFPSDSQQYLYAHLELYGEMPSGSTNAPTSESPSSDVTNESGDYPDAISVAQVADKSEQSG